MRHSHSLTGDALQTRHSTGDGDESLLSILLSKQLKLESRLFDLQAAYRSAYEASAVLEERKDSLAHEVHAQKYEQVQEKKKLEELAAKRDIKQRQADRTMFILKKREEIHTIDEKVNELYTAVLRRVGGIEGVCELGELDSDKIVHKLSSVMQAKAKILAQVLENSQWAHMKYAFSKIEQHKLRRMARRLHESKVLSGLGALLRSRKALAFHSLREFLEAEEEFDEAQVSDYWLKKRCLAEWKSAFQKEASRRNKLRRLFVVLQQAERTGRRADSHFAFMRVVMEAMKWFKRAALIGQLVQRLDLYRFRPFRILRKFNHLAKESLNKLHSTIEKR